MEVCWVEGEIVSRTLTVVNVLEVDVASDGLVHDRDVHDDLGRYFRNDGVYREGEDDIDGCSFLGIARSVMLGKEFCIDDCCEHATARNENMGLVL